jgi:subtilisin family serine protease
MDRITLQYGGRPLTLTKSDHLVGVKAEPGTDLAHLSALGPAAVPASTGPALGGFRLLNVAAAALPMEEALDTLRAKATVAAGTHVFHTSDDGVPFIPTGQLYVSWDPEAPKADVQALFDELALEVVEARGEHAAVAQVTPASPNPIKVAAALQESQWVEAAEPDLATPGRLAAFAPPPDPRMADQWHLRNTGFHRGTSLGFRAGADARVVDAWARAESLGSPNVVVAVIDDGFDLAHPDLSGDWKIVAPKDFTRNSASPLPDPLLEDWHGTACAGVAVGNADGSGIVGAAPRCRLMPIRWSQALSDRSVEAWFDYVREQGAWVVSCSWSARARHFPLSTRMSDAISRCAREGRGGLGCVITFAAGNENRDINDPANASVNGFAIHPDVVAVSAINSRDERSSYSNFGARVWVCAPSSGSGGWRITTSDVMGQYRRGDQTFEAGYSVGAYTDDFGGTSSACPLVAGVCALLLSIRPELTAQEVREVLRRTARPVGGAGAGGHSPQYGHGCVDAAAAVSAVLGGGGPQPLWGKEGHRTINRLAVSAVPVPLNAFYEVHLEEVVAHAMDADHAKGSDPAEKPRHFIDIDLYGSFPFSELPEDRAAAEARFGPETVLGRGILPWQIGDTYRLLVEAFRQHDRAAILRHSAWLGHYVGDAHVPFHTTANHDGQLTGQKGLHSYFESRLVREHVDPAQLRPGPAQPPAAPVHVEAFRWVRESYGFLQSLLDADAANGGRSGRRNLAGFAVLAGPIAMDRLAKGCSRTAGLWLGAWQEAGSPDPGAL